MTHLRKHPRRTFLCEAILHVGDRTYVAEVLDLGAGGVGLRTQISVATGTEVRVFIDPHAVGASIELPTLGGVVMSVRPVDADGVPRFRLAVQFRPLLAEARTAVEALVEALGGPPRGTPMGGVPVLSSDELLMQARELIHSGNFAEARAAAIAAMRKDPQRARQARALVFRANAEQALAEGHREVAARESAAALALFPDDPALKELDARARPKRGGLLARIFSR